MGNASVFGIGNMQAVGNGQITLSGQMQEDVQIQFSEVINQMASQAGNVSYTQEREADGQMPDDGTVTQTSRDSYEKYQYRENTVRKALDSETYVDEKQLDESVESYAKDVTEVLKETLGVTDEQIAQAMELLGISAVDLVNPQQLAALMGELMGCENPAELLCNAEFLAVLGEVKTLSNELLQELGMTPEELLQSYTAMGETSDVQIEIPAQEQTGGTAQISQPKDTVEQQNQNGQQTADDAVVLVTREDTGASSVSAETEQQRTMSTNEQSLTEETVVQQTGEQEAWKETASGGGQQTDAQSQGNNLNHAAALEQGHTDAVEIPVPETSAKPVSQLDALDMIRQITEFTKVTVKTAQTTMEMQLNPEHLGKLYIEVTTKEGNVSAHILTQNELVKEALEAQLVELRQSLNQAGVKVDAVEVSVGSHEFEKNLEQNAKQEEHQGEEQEKASNAGRLRRISRNELDELTGVMSEEETLVAQMMAEQGNSVDFTA